MDNPFYQDLCSNYFNNTQAMEQVEKQKKKKCRGNRKLQRYRRRLRKQCVKLPINEKLSTANVIMEPTESAIISPIVAETAASMKKCKTVATAKDSVDYTTTSDEVLHQKTSQAFSRSEKFDNIFNPVEKIHFIRQYISLIDQLSFQQLQESQWKYYHHIGTTRNIWHGRMSKVTAEKYSINYIYETTKSAIEQFERDILLKCGNIDDCIYAMKELYLILSQLVQEKQQVLRNQFEYKREILVLDATDHYLLQRFLITEPNKTHIILARRIWKAAKEQLIAKQEIALLQYRLLSTSLISKSVSDLVHEMIDNIDTNIKTLDDTVETSSTTDCLSNEIEKLKSSKNDIIHHAILTLEKKIENLNKIIQNERNKFFKRNRFMESTSQWQQMVLDAIENRRMHMTERANYIKTYKLAT
ncbi:unnamed protein product [Adineta ricciae]|uniref:Uncharacterized protein n=1 Tax=Adineta ricciae TaxID=249248 RepID=A0A815JD10_ADIRI|nr:unnamed protein product [Adineta ricciae]CAF1614047.1 unnamed protein product [Adineta ricciae]